MAEVWVPQRVNVHIAATPEVPGGAVIVLVPGLNLVPPELEADPFIANLIVTSEQEVALAHRAADAKVLIDEHLSEGKGATKTAAGDEWTVANQAAIDAGLPFADPHPDPVVQRSLTLTSALHFYATTAVPPVAASKRVDPDGTARGGSHGRGGNDHGRVRPEV